MDINTSERGRGGREVVSGWRMVDGVLQSKK